MKICYIISNIDRWQQFEWLAESFRNVDIELNFILIGDSKGFFYSWLRQNGFNVQFVTLNSKLNYPYCIITLVRLINSLKPDLIHTHFLDATICGLISAFICGIKRRIYTRHHSVFHHRYAKKGVIFDKISNFLATKIISISQVTSSVLINKEKVNPSKIRLIYHGFDFEKVRKFNNDDILKIKAKYEIDDNRIIIGVVSRLIDWKGVDFIIKAFNKLSAENRKFHLIMVNARGPEKDKITKLLNETPKNKVTLIEFEESIYPLISCFDIFIHTPIDPEVEAFGQVYIESILLNIPSIITKSGIASEYFTFKNFYPVPFKDSETIYMMINNILDNEFGVYPVRDIDLDQFHITTMVQKLISLYYED